jgi:endogenous inhibitor of DNA gyrase (YacG/DUF329 family)
MLSGENTMSEKKPIIAPATAARNNCPVCGKPSYSATGTHPQCAVARADSVSRAARKAAGVEVVKPPRKSWSKPCPKCKREVPARRLDCDCGHKFAAAPALSFGQSAKPRPAAPAKKPR